MHEEEGATWGRVQSSWKTDTIFVALALRVRWLQIFSLDKSFSCAFANSIGRCVSLAVTMCRIVTPGIRLLQQA